MGGTPHAYAVAFDWFHPYGDLNPPSENVIAASASGAVEQALRKVAAEHAARVPELGEIDSAPQMPFQQAWEIAGEVLYVTAVVRVVLEHLDWSGP